LIIILFLSGGLSGIRKECELVAAKEGSDTVIADLKSEITDKIMEVIREENSKAVFVDYDI
jgi:hypothetical protein